MNDSDQFLMYVCTYFNTSLHHVRIVLKKMNKRYSGDVGFSIGWASLSCALPRGEQRDLSQHEDCTLYHWDVIYQTVNTRVSLR